MTNSLGDACGPGSTLQPAAFTSIPIADEYEIRADGVRVRKDRWEVGIRRIVALLWGNRHEFEVDEVVEAVRALLAEPFNDGDDEGLVRSVYGMHARGIAAETEGCSEEPGPDRGAP